MAPFYDAIHDIEKRIVRRQADILEKLTRYTAMLLNSNIKINFLIYYNN
jgi:hypothetical protein